VCVAYDVSRTTVAAARAGRPAAVRPSVAAYGRSHAPRAPRPRPPTTEARKGRPFAIVVRVRGTRARLSGAGQTKRPRAFANGRTANAKRARGPGGHVVYATYVFFLIHKNVRCMPSRGACAELRTFISFIGCEVCVCVKDGYHNNNNNIMSLVSC